MRTVANISLTITALLSAAEALAKTPTGHLEGDPLKRQSAIFSTLVADWALLRRDTKAEVAAAPDDGSPPTAWEDRIVDLGTRAFATNAHKVMAPYIGAICAARPSMTCKNHGAGGGQLDGGRMGRALLAEDKTTLATLDKGTWRT